MYSSTLSLTLVLHGLGVQRHAPAALPPGKWSTSHCIGGCVGPRDGLDVYGKSHPPPGSDPRTVQPVASRYTDWAIPYGFVSACFPPAGYKTISCRAMLKPAGVATSWQLLVYLNCWRLLGLSHNRFGASSKGRHIYRQTELATGMVDDFYWDICSLERIFLESMAGGSNTRTAKPSTYCDPECALRFCVRLLNSMSQFAPRFNCIFQTRTANSTVDICQQKAGKAKSRTLVISYSRVHINRRVGRCFILTHWGRVTQISVFYVTTVQDGWRKSAFLTRACFPCTIHLIMQYIEPFSEWSCWRMLIETWPHSELTFRNRASST